MKSEPNPFYLIDAQRIGTARKGEHFVEPAKPPSDKLTQVYLALVNLCAPLGYIAFLMPKLESVTGSESDLAGIKDRAYWRLAKPELAVCDSDGKLKLMVIKSTTKRVHKEDLENLRVPYRHLSGLEPPEKEAATLLAAAKLPAVDRDGNMSPPQLTTARYLGRYLRVGSSGDKDHVQPSQSKLTPEQRDEVGHYVRTRHWFLVNEVTAMLQGVSAELANSRKSAEQLGKC